MKSFVVLIVFLSVQASASVFVETNLKFGMQIDGSYISKSGGFAGIGRKEKVRHYSNTHYGYMGNGRYESDAELKYEVKGISTSPESYDDFLVRTKPERDAYARCLERKAEQERQNQDAQNARGRGRQYGQQVIMCRLSDWVEQQERNMLRARNFRNPRNSTVQLKFTEIENGKRVEVILSDRQEHRTVDFGGRHTARYFNDSIAGKIRIGLVMPENTWAVIVKRTKMEGVFAGRVVNATVESGLSNSFNKDVTHGGLGEFVIWGKPGSEITQDIVFDSYTQGQNVEGQISLEFSFIQFDLDKVATKDLISSIERTAANLDAVNSFRNLITALKPMLYLHGRESRLNDIISLMSTAEILDFVRVLSTIAYDAGMNPYRWDIKASAAILAHEVALKLLRELSVFCKRIEIELPYTKEKAKVLGLNAASYLLDSAKLRVQYALYAPFEAVIKQVEKFESEGLTYADVRSNAALFGPLYEAYNLITETVDMRYSTYQSVADEINWVFEQFDSVGAPGRGNHEIMGLVAQLKNQDTVFYDEFVSGLRRFQADNQEKISAKALRDSLNRLNENRIRLFEALQERAKAGQPEGETLQQSVMRLVQFNVMIFTQEYRYKSFEAFRKNYFDPAKVNPVLNSVNACIGND